MTRSCCQVSDANLRRYGISPATLTSAMVCASFAGVYGISLLLLQMADDRVQSYCIFIASLADEVLDMGIRCILTQRCSTDFFHGLLFFECRSTRYCRSCRLVAPSLAQTQRSCPTSSRPSSIPRHCCRESYILHGPYKHVHTRGPFSPVSVRRRCAAQTCARRSGSRRRE